MKNRPAIIQRYYQNKALAVSTLESDVEELVNTNKALEDKVALLEETILNSKEVPKDTVVFDPRIHTHRYSPNFTTEQYEEIIEAYEVATLDAISKGKKKLSRKAFSEDIALSNVVGLAATTINYIIKEYLLNKGNSNEQ